MNPPSDAPLDLPADVRRLVAEDVAVHLWNRLLRLERHIETLPEPSMRRTVVVEAVRNLESSDLVATLVLLMARVQAGSGRARLVLQQLALEPTVFREMPYERVEAAYRIARSSQMDGIARIFLSAALEPPDGAGDAFVGNRHLDLPLGNRRAAARGANRYQLDRLVHDRDHRVISILLDNPRITERDAIRIAAMRPTRPEVLEVVARHPRWSTRYKVRKALACNPATPAPIAHRLLPTLMRQDLRHALESGALTADMAREVRQLLRGRDADVERVAADQEMPTRALPSASTGHEPPPTPEPPARADLADDEVGV